MNNIFNSEKILCVIPARTGSTRLKNKNLLEIYKNLNLIEQAIETAGEFETIITTDKPELIKVPKYITKIKRPVEISDSKSNVCHAISHATKVYEEIKKKSFDTIVTLMPAIACRSNEILSDMLSKYFLNYNVKSAITITETHPWIWKIDEKKITNSWEPNKQKNSQDLPKYFIEHASIIINSRNTIEKNKKWEFPLMFYTLPSWGVALDIDNKRDLYFAKKLYPSMRLLLREWEGKTYLTDKIHPISPD